MEGRTKQSQSETERVEMQERGVRCIFVRMHVVRGTRSQADSQCGFFLCFLFRLAGVLYLYLYKRLLFTNCPTDCSVQQVSGCFWQPVCLGPWLCGGWEPRSALFSPRLKSSLGGQQDQLCQPLSHTPVYPHPNAEPACTHTDVSGSGPSPLGATRTLCFPHPAPSPPPSFHPHSSPCPLSLEIAVLLTA